ncbi:MAG: zinc-dependent metalloprotease [Bacteroidaceae bacterium]|jgi:hypothetical protein
MNKKIILIGCIVGMLAFDPLLCLAAGTSQDDVTSQVQVKNVSKNASKEKKQKDNKATLPVANATDKSKQPLGPVNQNIRQIVSNKESMFQVSKENDNWFFTIPDSLIGRLFLAVTRFTTTPAGYGKYGGEELREQTVYFEVSPDGKNLFLKSDIIYSKADTLDAINKAVNNSTSNPIIQSFKLETGAPANHYKINVGNFLLSENSFSLDKETKQNLGIAAMMGDGASYVESVHSYPINVEVKTVRTYFSNSDRLPSADVTNTISLGLNTSYLLLPKEPMRARIFDPRVGYFTDDYFVFSDNQQKLQRKQFVTRWRLEPKPEDVEKMKHGEFVEPKKQIVYYIDPATPKQWRPYLIAGVNDWNKAFEQAGFKNAIVAKEWPDSNKDMSLEDARFAVIRYLASPIANAYGPQVHDPRSGEILESHVGWYHNVMTLVHDWYTIQAANVDKRARSAKFDDELMGQLIRFVSSHEIGHTLGLRHNFGSSSTVPVEKLRDKAWVAVHGHTPSIMDYARFNYVAQPEDSMSENELFPRINDYDKWAIQWGYSPIWKATDSESDRFFLSQITTDSLHANRRLWWGDGEGYRKDPRRQTEDLGDDAVKASEYGIRNLKAEIPHLQKWSYWGNDTEDQNLKNIYNELVGQFLRYCGHVMRYISGNYVDIKSPDEPGDVYSQTPRDKEKAVLPFFNRNIFTAPTWLIDVPYINRISDNKEALMERLGEFVVSNLTNANILENLNSNYPVQEYLPELTQMLFKELYTNQPVSTYRRFLQRTFVNNLTGYFNSAKINKGSDALAYTLLTLKELNKRAKAASTTSGDNMTRAHYIQISDQIERALNQNGSVIAAQ